MVVKRIGVAVLLALAGCGGQSDGPQQQATNVGFVTIQPQPVTLTTVLPGRTSAYETSEVRPQVSGLVRERLFAEGDFVRKGQPLYRIDAEPYRAQVASARAALARAQAIVNSNTALARRYGELVKINAISKQEYENALATAQQTQADVAAQQAALRSAEIDLERTTVRAPISGRIGRSVFTTGALVTAGQQDPLTTIQRLNPIYVDIQQSSADLLRLRQQIASGELVRNGSAPVRLRLETGTLYPAEGRLRFADVTVDPDTGTQTIRAVFPNPDGLLLPGMFVRAELVEGIKENGILLTQRAVSRDERGRATVMLVGPGNKAMPRAITTSRTIGSNWLVTDGLHAGDKVIVEGTTMLQPGAPVNAQPWSRPAENTPDEGQPDAKTDRPAANSQAK